MAAQTLIQKIIASHVGKESVEVGETFVLQPDVMFLYNWPAITDRYMDMLDEELKVEPYPHPDRIIYFLDHFIPQLTAEQDRLYKKSKAWCEKHGVRCIEEEGIGHTVMVEKGYVTPGSIAIHFDQHVSTAGAIGALGLGIMAEIVMAIATGNIWLSVPPTIRVELTGRFQAGVSGRDLLNILVADHGPHWATGYAVEFGGPGAVHVSIDSRMTICDLINYVGANTALFVPDETTFAYLKAHQINSARAKAPDPEAKYAFTVEYDLSKIEPMVSPPGFISKSIGIAQAEGKPVDVGIIGTCASGRLEDLRDAAAVLRGKKVANGFKLFVSPSSNQAFQEGIAAGYVSDLVLAGAFLCSPTCDFCYGKAVTLSAGQTAISTQTLNVPGRLGSLDANIYLANAGTVAATALNGAITDPRTFLGGA